MVNHALPPAILCIVIALQAVAFASDTVPIPRPKPDLNSENTEGNTGWPAPAVAEAKARCQALLAGLDIQFSVADPIGSEGQCGAPAPIQVSAIAGAAIKPPAIMTCELAAALHGWISQSVQPAAKTKLGTAVSTIHNGSSYVCRRRNNAASGKMSEHAKANALDMSGFSFAKNEAIAVGDGWEIVRQVASATEAQSFMAGIRADACKYFTTVLGPGSDPNHGDHFHVDVLERKGGYRICQ